MRPKAASQRAQIAVSSLGGFRTAAARVCGILRRGRHLKTFITITDSCTAASDIHDCSVLLDHLVIADEESRPDGQAERTGD
jgi:hypothetical protein